MARVGFMGAADYSCRTYVAFAGALPDAPVKPKTVCAAFRPPLRLRKTPQAALKARETARPSYRPAGRPKARPIHGRCNRAKKLCRSYVGLAENHARRQKW